MPPNQFGSFGSFGGNFGFGEPTQQQRAESEFAIAQQLAEEEAEDSPGLLRRIGNAFEAADSRFRGLLARGRLEPISPAEFNQEVFGAEPTPEGEFPTAEIATSLVVSPFNFLGGIGGATKAGRLALRARDIKIAQQLQRGGVSNASTLASLADSLGLGKNVVSKEALRLAKTAQFDELETALTSIRGQLGRLGAPEELGRTLAERISNRQAGLLTGGLPFGEQLRIPIPGEETLARGLGAVGSGARRAAEATGLDRAFRRLPRDPEQRALVQSLISSRRGVKATTPELEETLEGLVKNFDLNNPADEERFFNLMEDVSKRSEHDGITDEVRQAIVKGDLAGRPANEAEFAQRMVDMSLELTQRQIESGGRGVGSLITEDDAVGYIMRLMTPQARTIIKNAKGDDALFRVIKDVIDKTPPRRGAAFDVTQLPRDQELKKLYTTEINRRLSIGIPELEGVQVFSTNIARVVSKGAEAKMLSRAVAEHAQSGIRQFAAPAINDGIPLSDFIQSAGLTRLTKESAEALGATFPGKFAKDVDFALRGQALNRGRIQEALEKIGLGDHMVPEDFARFFLQNARPFFDPLSENGFVRFFDVTTKTVANWLTNLFPAFHVRNGISNVALAAVNGGINPARMVQYLTKMAAARNDPQLMSHMKRLGVIFDRRAAGGVAGRAGELTNDVEMAADMLGTVGRVDVRTKTQKIVDAINLPPTKAGRVGQAVDNGFRGAGYLYAKEVLKLTDGEAVNFVNRVFYDMNLLTDFEQKYANRILFFYRWSSNNIPQMVRTLFTNPRSAAALSKATTAPFIESDPAVPEFARAQGAVPFGESPEGDPQVVSRFGLPFEDLERFDVGARGVFAPLEDPLGTASSTLREATRSTTPLILSTVELLAGRDFFLNQPLDQLGRRAPSVFRLLPKPIKDALKFEVTPPELGGGVERFKMDPLADFLLRKSPFSRVIASIRKVDVGEDREGANFAMSRAAIAQLLLGVQVTSLREVDGVIRNAQRRIDNELARQQAKGNIMRSAQGHRFVPSEKKSTENDVDRTEAEFLIRLNSDLSQLRRRLRQNPEMREQLKNRQPLPAEQIQGLLDARRRRR